MNTNDEVKKLNELIKDKTILGSYKNGNYTVTICSDGTKIRILPDGEKDFNPDFPESIDMTITDYCDGGCEYCYANCSQMGTHCDFDKYAFLFESVHPYTELAINGNDLSHPGLSSFLTDMRDKHVLVNMTVNQKHFMNVKNLELLHEFVDNKQIVALGVSLTGEITPEFIHALKSFPNVVVHVIAGITTLYELTTLASNDIKVLVLGYKRVGKGNPYYDEHKDDVEYNISLLKYALPEIFYDFKAIAFDNLALRQLDVKSMLSEDDWDTFYMGDDATHTFFVNLVKGVFAKSSLDSDNTYPIDGQTLDECFNQIKVTSSIGA